MSFFPVLPDDIVEQMQRVSGLAPALIAEAGAAFVACHGGSRDEAEHWMAVAVADLTSPEKIDYYRAQCAAEMIFEMELLEEFFSELRLQRRLGLLSA